MIYDKNMHNDIKMSLNIDKLKIFYKLMEQCIQELSENYDITLKYGNNNFNQILEFIMFDVNKCFTIY